MQIKNVLLLTILATLILSCGFKGPLYLPSQSTSMDKTVEQPIANHMVAESHLITSMPKSNTNMAKPIDRAIN